MEISVRIRISARAFEVDLNFFAVETGSARREVGDVVVVESFARREGNWCSGSLRSGIYQAALYSKTAGVAELKNLSDNSTILRLGKRGHNGGRNSWILSTINWHR